LHINYPTINRLIFRSRLVANRSNLGVYSLNGSNIDNTSESKSTNQYSSNEVVNYAYVGSKKGKGFPYSISSVQTVSPQVSVSHPPGGRLPLLSSRPAVTFQAAEHHRSLAGTKLYCLVTEAHKCEQLAQDCYAALPRVGFEPATY